MGGPSSGVGGPSSGAEDLALEQGNRTLEQGDNLQLIHLSLSRSNQSGVFISTDVFDVCMLQVKINRRNYNSYVVIYIT